MQEEFYTFPPSYGREIGKKKTFITSEEELFSYVNKWNGKTDLYCSVYPFHSPRNYDSCIVDRLYFDFDTGEGYDPLKELLKIHDFCKTYNVRRLLVSSGNGYNAYLFCDPVTKNQKPTLTKSQHKIIEHLKLQCDPHCVGDVARISRVLFSYNFDAKRYCVPLYSQDLKDLDNLEKIRNQSLRPLRLEGNRLLHLPESIAEERIATTRATPTITDPIIGGLDVNDLPHCVRQILLLPNPKHLQRFLLVAHLSYLLSLGDIMVLERKEREIIAKEIYSFIERNQHWDDWDPQVTNYQVFNIVLTPYFVPNACSFAVKKGLCELCVNYN